MNEEKDNVVSEYEMTAEEVAVIREFDVAMAELNSQKQGALRMIAKQQKLEGMLDLVGNKLVRREEPGPQPVLKALK